MTTSGEMQELVGRRIVGIQLDKRQEYLVFETDAGPIIYHAYGRCCSVSWFEHLDGVAALLGGTVASVENATGSATRTDSMLLQWDFIKFRTDKGHATLEFRNSSNGWYSGQVDLYEPDPDDDPLEDLSPVTEDF